LVDVVFTERCFQCLGEEVWATSFTIDSDGQVWIGF